MKIKLVLSTIIAALALSFIACDDDLESVGTSIRPDSDGIFLGVDTFDITAKTIKWDYIYAKTTEGMLGEYEDPVFGSIKSDYLSEFFCQKDVDFEKNFLRVDSITIDIIVSSFVGDSISPMGVSVYRVTKNLERNFYTNINPSDYCDMTQVLGRNFFSLASIKTSGYSKRVSVKLDNSVGEEFYKKWEEDPSTFHDTKKLREFFPGIYITQTFGTGAIMNVAYTIFNLDYSYIGRNYNDTEDSVRTTLFQLGTTPEVIQMNHIENTNIDKLLDEGNPKRTYMKTPAGVYTELTIPLNKIANIVKKDTIVNSANVILKGLTEEEQYSGFSRPTALLFINKDSIDDFFTTKRLPDNITNFIIPYSSSNNTYNFANSYSMKYSNINGGLAPSLPKTINYYLDKFRKDGYTTIPDIKFVLIPVKISETSSSSYYGTTSTLNSVSNLMSPTSAIIRTDEVNMKLPIVFTRYNER